MKISTQKIAFIAMMSAFCVIGRLGMLSLPNVQPITVVVIWMTLELGWGYGVSISILSILISNLLISMAVDSLSDGKFCPRLRVCIASSSVVAKKKTISAPSLDSFSNLRRTDGLLIWLYHLAFLGIQHAWSEFLDLLCQRNSI